MGEKIKEKTLSLFEGESLEEVVMSVERTKKIRPTLTGMEVGDVVAFPVVQMKSVRAQASELGVILDRKFQTRLNRQERTLIVTRTA